MSNRRRPSNQRRGVHELQFVDSIADALADLDRFRCPDCDSELHPMMVGKYVASIDVRHDDTCPWWRAAQGVVR